jgi:hypothetical protein
VTTPTDIINAYRSADPATRLNLLKTGREDIAKQSAIIEQAYKEAEAGGDASLPTVLNLIAGAVGTLLAAVEFLFGVVEIEKVENQ